MEVWLWLRPWHSETLSLWLWLWMWLWIWLQFDIWNAKFLYNILILTSTWKFGNFETLRLINYASETSTWLWFWLWIFDLDFDFHFDILKFWNFHFELETEKVWKFETLTDSDFEFGNFEALILWLLFRLWYFEMSKLRLGLLHVLTFKVL